MKMKMCKMNCDNKMNCNVWAFTKQQSGMTHQCNLISHNITRTIMTSFHSADSVTVLLSSLHKGTVYN